MIISIIIPTCDRQNFVIQTIQTIFRQTIKPHEIIVVNNGQSPFDLPEELKNKVKIYNIPHYAGVAQARNFGAGIASGDFLAFLDDDDSWNSHYLENITNAAQAGAKCIVSRLCQLVGGKISPSKTTTSSDITIKNILTFNPGITGTNLSIAKQIFFQVGGYDPKLPPSEDKSLVLEVLKAGIPVQFLEDNIAIIKEHTGKRLSNNYLKMAEGIYQFTHKYSHLMNHKQYLVNYLKIYHYQYRAGSNLAYLKYLLTKIILCICLSGKKSD